VTVNEARGTWTWTQVTTVAVGILIFTSPGWLPRVGLGSTAGLSVSESQRIGWDEAVDFDDIARDIYERVNDERLARGAPPLVWDDALAAMAQRWSEQMITIGYEHSSEEFRIHPRFAGTGENILKGYRSSDGAHVGWMRSPGHREIILNADFDAIGIGVVCRKDGRMWATQIFGVYANRSSLRPPVPDGPDPIVRRDPGIECPASFRLVP
jgi:hypothetical protein